MDNQAMNTAFAELSTPLVADACLRLDVPYRVAPPGIRPVIAGTRLAGHATPVRHYGSVDVFLEATDTAQSLALTSDGGALVGGYRDYHDEEEGEAWVFRIDSRGRLLWERTFGGEGDEETEAVWPTAGGGAIAIGWTESEGSGGSDAWAALLDSRGKAP